MKRNFMREHFLMIGAGLLAAALAAATSLPTRGAQPASAPSALARRLATDFLTHIDHGNVDQAIKLFDAKVSNDKLTERLNKMSAKLKSFGGIAKVDVGTCEERRPREYEKRTGEKIDVIPVEISCRDRTLILAVFSIRKVDGSTLPRIFMLESLKEWGGTASLDEELPYRH